MALPALRNRKPHTFYLNLLHPFYKTCEGGQVLLRTSTNQIISPVTKQQRPKLNSFSLSHQQLPRQNKHEPPVNSQNYQFRYNLQRHDHVQCPQPQSSLQVGSGICLPPQEIHVGLSSPTQPQFQRLAKASQVCAMKEMLWMTSVVEMQYSGSNTSVIPLSPSAACCRFAKETRAA